MARLSPDEIQQRLQMLKGWTLDGNVIRKPFSFPSFPDAVAFVVRVAFGAEAADHHPEILVSYKRVTLSYSTHSEGGLTEKDFAGATAADEIAPG